MGKLGLFGLTVMALLLLTPITYAKASEPEPPTNSRWRFGVEASVGTPVINTRKMTSTGFGLCMFAENKTEGFGLSVDYVSLGKKKWEQMALPREITTSIDIVNAQFYLIRSFNSGIYCLSGMGLGSGNITSNSSSDSHSFALMLSFGLGYSFNRNFGIVAKCTGTGGKLHRFDKDLLQGEALYYLNLGIQYRF